MRLFACFTRSSAVDSPPRQSSHHSSERQLQPQRNPHDNFVPTSIPELHPEYAHAEPYRFAARTQSARLLVEKQREAQALSMSPRRHQPPVEEPAVVVRGPTYNANKVAAAHSTSLVTLKAVAKPPRPVSLKVESPTTVDENYVDSDDTSGQRDENADINRSNPSTRSPRRKPSVSSTALSVPKSKSKGKSKSKKGRKSSVTASKSNSFRIRSKSSKSFKHSKRRTATHSRNISDPSGSVSDIAASESISHLPPSTTNSTIPSPPGSEFESLHDTSFIADHIKPHLDNTPAELLEPIRVPRMSAAFQPKRSGSPVISTDSWGPQDSSSQRRYEDVEGDSSSGLISVPPVGKQRVVHKASYPSRAPELPSYAPPSPLHTSSPSVSNRVRSKRKSKPYILANSDSDHTPHIEESVPPPELPMDSFPLSKSRRSIMSTDPAPTREIPRIVQAAARDRIRSDESFPPAVPPRAQAGNAPQSIMRRASSGKRKTVSFHTAAPTIIEPNLRAPSYSVPRDVVLSREEVRPEVPARLAPALRKTRDSIKFASSSLPRTFDSRDDLSMQTEQDSEAQKSMIRSISAPYAGKDPASHSEFIRPEAVQTGASRTTQTRMRRSASATVVEDSSTADDRNMSDFSAGSDESFIARASRRMSTRVVKDREELREASKRQSRAVANAMASQIRGVPKSAMLAFSENDIVLADGFEEDDDSSSRISLRRKSRQVKSVQLPSIKAGVVPKPPPPPPFAPQASRVKSVRMPPPPPVSPLPH